MRRLLVMAMAATVLVALPASPALASTSAEGEFISLINQDRRARGLTDLTPHWDLTDDARAQSDRMAGSGTIWHNPDLANVTSGWYGLAENVGMGPGVSILHQAFMNSPGHRANILGDFNYAGVGVTLDQHGTIFVTVVFMRGPAGLAGTYSPPFWDDDGSMHESDIVSLWEAGITTGCAGDRFCPHDSVTRAQMAAFLSRALELPDGGNAFSDDDGHLLERDINAVAASGITVGCAGDRFCPDDPVSRAEMAALLSRALELPDGANAFSDDEGHALESHVNALAASGITNGCAPGAFCPDRYVSRAEMASFLARAFDY